MFNPHEYQKRIIDLIGTGKSIGVWAEMGLGKTVSVLTALAQKKQFSTFKALVVAPPYVAKHTWPGELKKWGHLSDLSMRVLDGTPAERERRLTEQADIYVISHNLLPWLFELYVKRTGSKWKWESPWPFDVVIIDEASRFKNHQGKWFKTMARIRRSDCQIIELTGTPASNGLADLWAQLYLLDGGERLYDGVGKFREKWLRPAGYIQSGGRLVPTKWIPLEGAKEEIYERVSDICVSLKAEDWIKMPEIVYVNDYVELPDKAAEAYRVMRRDGIVDDIYAGSPAAILSKLLQIANGRVYDEDGRVHYYHSEKAEFLKDVEGPAIIFYSFDHDLEAIMAVPGTVHIKTPGAIEKWNAGEIELLVAHPASVGHGLNLQAGGNVVIWYGLTYNLELYQQANARLYRQGQKESHVIVHHILAEGTIEDRVLEVLQDKDAVQEDLLQTVKMP